MALLVRNGEIVTADSRFRADVLCEGEQITRIGRDLEAPPDVEIIDATDCYVFPGFIDPHVHVYLPFMGTFAKDTWETAGRAALAGGTTTLIEMICPARHESLWAAYRLWRSKAEGISPCDFTFHMGVTHWDEEAERDLREIVRTGVTSFKVFLAYKGALGISDTELYHTLRLAAELGVVVTAHCENADLVAELQKKLLAEGKTGPEWHYWSRPPRVEAEGVHHLATFAELTGASVYCVHTSCAEALQEAYRARERGVRLWIETLIQYLLLDRSHAELPSFEGAKYVMSPPLRDRCNQDTLWNGLAQGLIDTVATDHAPFDFKGQKEMGRNDFTKIPNGIPSLEDRVTLLWTHGPAAGRITLNRFVEIASTNAARIFGLFPRKGTIAVGSDADLVVWNPRHRGVIRAANHHMNVDYNPFEGYEITGRPEIVVLRGRIAVRSGKIMAESGWGRFLERKTNR